jgi:MFS family permease
MRRRAVIGSTMGTVLEFYDFIIYGTAAAIVFPSVFFSGVDPIVGTYAAFGTLAVGYFARPLGGIIFGHFGDRLGRKRMLVITMLILGVATFIVGIIPSSETIGSWAPIILITVRLAQGIAIGGETGGAVLTSMEHAKPKNRGFAGSLVFAGAPAGVILAFLVTSIVSATTGDAYETWGWRIPFLLSIVLFIAAFWIRTGVTETPEFEEKVAARSDTPRRAPLLDMFARHPRALGLATMVTVAPLFLQSLTNVFILTYAVDTLDYDRTTVLNVLTLGNAVLMFSMVGAAVLSDTIGRKIVMAAGSITATALIWPYFAALQSVTLLGLLVSLCIINPLLIGFMTGPLPAWIGEQFPAEIRYTGVSVSYQVGTSIGAGLGPLVATALLTAGGSTLWISLLFIGLTVANIVAILLSRPWQAGHVAQARTKSGATQDA